MSSPPNLSAGRRASPSRRARRRQIDLGTLVGGALIAFCIAVLTTPAGVSGAVMLVPVQVSILGVANPAVTPTNLLYNLIAVPGGLAGYRRRTRDTALARILILGSVPGVVIGAILRVKALEGPEVFYAVIAVVLLPLGAWLLLGSTRSGRGGGRVPTGQLVALSLAVGVIGGIYGIGGGAVLAPVLVGLGFAAAEIAPATLLATFLTSIAGVATFALLSIGQSGSIAPEWTLGIALGLGGLAGGYLGARLQPRLPEVLIRRGLGLLCVGLAVRYGILGFG